MLSKVGKNEFKAKSPIILFFRGRWCYAAASKR
jgi:hypothetical protein